MMDPLRNGKLADSKASHIVFGYVRDMEITLKLTEITEYIIHIILGFYFNYEYFASYLKEHFEVSPDKLTITNIKKVDFRRHTIYLNHWIASTSKCIARWTFKINSFQPIAMTEMYFGLVSSQQAPNEDFATIEQQHVPNYCIANSGSRYPNGKSIGTIGQSFKIKEGDIVTFTLDLIVGTWNGKIHDKTDTLIINDVEISEDIKYKLAVQIRQQGSSITLLDYNLMTT